MSSERKDEGTETEAIPYGDLVLNYLKHNYRY